MSVLQNKRLPYWNYSAGFDFDHITVIRMIICTQGAKLYPYRTIQCRNMTSCRFFNMAAAAAQYYFRFPSCWSHCIRKLKIYQQTKLSSTYIISWLRYNYFRFKKNKRPPYWNSTSDFDFRYITGIGMLFCIRLTNFIEMRPFTAARPELGSAVLKICVINRHRTLFTWVDCPACQFSLSTERARRSFVRRKNECLNYT